MITTMKSLCIIKQPNTQALTKTEKAKKRRSLFLCADFAQKPNSKFIQWAGKDQTACSEF